MSNGKHQITLIEQQFSGPLPPPATLSQYDKILPGAAERILAMAEREQKNRHISEDKKADARINLAKHGQIFGFVLAVLFAILAFCLAYIGHLKLAAGFGAPLIIGVCCIFVLRRQPTNNMEDS